MHQAKACKRGKEREEMRQRTMFGLLVREYHFPQGAPESHYDPRFKSHALNVSVGRRGRWPRFLHTRFLCSLTLVVAR